MRVIEDLKLKTGPDGTTTIDVTAHGITLSKMVMASELKVKPLHMQVAELHDDAEEISDDLRDRGIGVLPKVLNMAPDALAMMMENAEFRKAV